MAETIEPIAVVGMACRFPGASDLEQYWRNLVDGRESVSFFSPEELRAAGVSEQELTNPDYVPAAPMMPDVDRFDADLFGMTATEARLCDPQIRVFIETCHSALEHAGYDPFAIEDSVAVYGTTGPNGYLRQSIANRPDLVDGTASMLLFSLNHADYLATLASYKLDLRGPSMTVLTACSSSLVATHLAAAALRAGECDVALAGGAVVEMPLGHGHVWTPGGVHTSDGHCKPFDSSASGTIFGSGAGVVVLKRLEDATAAGDDIRAVILGSAVNNDGADKVSYSAPSPSGQAAATIEAMALAGVRPDEVDYVEAHATGTALGDPVEVAGLTDAYAALADGPLPVGSCAIGSVKSNIGHMTVVAGMAGLIKTVLMLEREAIPPSINVATPNPRLELDRTPFTLATELRPWPRRAERQRIAGINSLGIGGTNAHLVLTEGPKPPRPATTETPRVVVWSARTEAAERELRANLVRHFATTGETDFADTVGVLQHGRTPHPMRAAVVCHNATAAVDALGGSDGKVITATALEPPATAFLFPGQGAQRARMAAGLYGSMRPFSIAMDECLERFDQQGVRLIDSWLGEDRVDATALVQPLLFAVEYALAAMWQEWGVRPTALLGHSVGELTAATVAGVFSLDDAVTLVAARAEAMAAHPVAGGLLAVTATEQDLTDLLPEGLAVAAVNGPRQTVVAGADVLLDKFAAELARAGRSTTRLAVSAAFHHPDWQRAVDRFAEAFGSVTAHAPSIPLYSGRTGEPVTEAQAADPSFWTGQLSRPVRFWPALRALLAEPNRLLLEVGPGRTLTGLARQHDSAVAVPTLRADTEDQLAVLRAAAELWTNGMAVDWEQAGQLPPHRRIAVPGYPYQRERYWIDPPTGSVLVPQQAAEPVTGPVTEPAAAGADAVVSVIEWVPAERPAPIEAAGTAIVLLPADADAALLAVLAVEKAGYRAIRIRPGDRYGEVAGEFTVRLDQPAELATVFERLTERSINPDLVVHAATMTPARSTDSGTLPGQLDAAFTSLLTMAKHAMGHQTRRLVVFTTESVDVSGNDRLTPANATVHGLIRTLLAENPNLLGGVVDVADRVGTADLAAELGVPEPAEAVALRGGRRWLPVERPLALPPVDREVIRERGVYLITGGLGGLGLALARQLAGTGLRPRLVLLGRHDPTRADTARAEEVRQALAELSVLGAEAHVALADVTDAPALRTAVAVAVARFGPINGLFHLAGVPGDRMIAFREHTDAAAVLAPKTSGTINLLELFADAAPLDLAVFFSSRAAADGLVGGGDYAAANAFLDATAQLAPLGAGRTLSVGWPVWQGPGMVDPNGPDITNLAATVARLAAGEKQGRPAAVRQETVWEAEFGPATSWVLDEHRVGRTPLLPGTGYLDVVIGAFRERLATSGGPVELTDVVFRAPFSDEKPRQLRVVFTPENTGYDFTVSSRPALDQFSDWIDHVTGQVASVSDARPVVDLSALRARLAAVDTSAASASKGVQPFTMGPRWRNIAQVWQAGEEKLVRLALSAAFHHDLDQHQLHPALLDTATAAVRAADEGSFVPFLYRRLVMYAELPVGFFSHVRRGPSGVDTATGDIDLIAEDGTVLVHIEGFTMRRVDFVDGWDEPATTSRPANTRSDTLPDAQATAFADQRPVDGIDPVDGMRLLLRLVASRVPPAVLVRPHVAGRPTPLAVPVTAHPVPAPSPAQTRPGPVTAVSPVNEQEESTEDRLRGLWAQALGAQPVGDDEDFFDAGGDSLAAVELMARIRAVFGTELNIGLLLETRTFGGLRAILSEHARVPSQA